MILVKHIVETSRHDMVLKLISTATGKVLSCGMPDEIDKQYYLCLVEVIYAAEDTRVSGLPIIVVEIGL